MVGGSLFYLQFGFPHFIGFFFLFVRRFRFWFTDLSPEALHRQELTGENTGKQSCNALPIKLVKFNISIKFYYCNT